MALLTLEKAPAGLKALLKESEFNHDVHRDWVHHGTLYNLAINRAEYAGNRITGYLVKNPMMSAVYYGQTTRKPDPEEPTNIFVEMVLPDVSYLQGAQEIWALGVTAVRDQHKKRRGSIFFEPTKSSLVMPHPERTNFSSTLTMELFAGGYGGWSWAKRHAEVIGAPVTRTVAVEKDVNVALQHALNHPAHIFMPEAETPPDLLTKLEGDCLFVQDVADIGWRRSVTMHRHEYWTISSSCQSWSTAGKATGLADPRGMTMPQFLAAARIFRPRAILVEQVQGFRQHEDYSHFLALTHWAGYYCWNEDICELSELCPIRRPRYLSIFVRESENWDMLPQYLKWGSFSTMYPLEFGSWLQSTEQEMQQLIPSENEKAIYMHPELFPQRKREVPSEHRIFQARVPGLTRIQPVAMAMYGQQHHLSLSLLQEKGLHGFFCQEAGQYRWYKPLELILLHLHTDAIIVLKPIEQAWRIIGNQIALPHALLQVLNMWRCLGVLPKDFRMHALFEKLRSIRMQANQIQVHTDDKAWYMAFPKDMGKLIARLNQFESCLGGGQVVDFQPQAEVFVHREFGHIPIAAIRQMSNIPNQLVVSNPKQDHPVLTEVVTKDLSEQDLLLNHPQPGESIQQSASKRPKLADAGTDLNQSAAQVRPFLIPGEYGVLEVMPFVAPEQIQLLWHHPTWLQSLDHDQTPTAKVPLRGTVLAFPNTTLPDHACNQVPELPKDRGLVLIRTPTKVKAYAFSPNTKVVQLPGFFAEEPQVFYDEYGEFHEFMTLRNGIMLMTEMHIEEACVDVDHVLSATTRVAIHTEVPVETDILVVVFQGNPDDVQHIVNMWFTHLSGEWLEQHGRKLRLQVLEDHCRLLFVPSNQVFATPIPILVQHVQIRLAKTLLKALHDPQGALIVIKHECKHMLEFQLPHEEELEPVFLATRHAFVLTEKGTSMTLVAFGKRVGGRATPSSLLEGKSVQKLTIQLWHSLWGGGPNPGSRQEHHHMLHTELAAMFHEEGHSIQDTPELVEKVLRDQGLAKVHHMLFRQPNRQEAFRKLCNDLDIPKPELRKKTTTTKFKFQKLAKHDVSSYQQAAQEFALQPGFFRYENGEEAMILQQFSAWTRGVCLMEPQQAEPWRKQGSQQSPDELAIFVPSPGKLEAIRPHQYVYAPAFDKDGRQALEAPSSSWERSK